MSINKTDGEKSLFKIQVELETLISFIFKALLKREIDPITLQYYKEMFKSYDLPSFIEQMVQTLIFNEEFYIRNFLEYEQTSNKDICYVFIHIHKTGGTSLNSMLKENLGEERVSFIIPSLKIIPLALINKWLIIDTHDTFENILAYIQRDMKIFTILRNPYDRLISLYRFAKSFDPKYYNPDTDPLIYLADKLELNEFYSNEFVKNFFYNSITRQIIPINYIQRWMEAYYSLREEERYDYLNKTVRKEIRHILEKFAFIGLLEDFEFSVKILGDILGIKFKEIKRENVTDNIAGLGTTKKEPIPKYALTEDFKLLVKDIVLFDEIVYEEGLKIYNDIKDRYKNGDLSFANKVIQNSSGYMALENILKYQSAPEAELKPYKIKLNKVAKFKDITIVNGELETYKVVKHISSEMGKFITLKVENANGINKINFSGYLNSELPINEAKINIDFVDGSRDTIRINLIEGYEEKYFED